MKRNASGQEVVDPRTGLCQSCRHMRVIASDRESQFYLCRLSATDDRFPKYPRLPVRACAGFQPREGSGS